MIERLDRGDSFCEIRAVFRHVTLQLRLGIRGAGDQDRACTCQGADDALAVAGMSELRRTLLDAARNATDESVGVNVASAGGAREYEEDAQNLTMLQTGDGLVARAEERLTRVERALAKIAEGTYGFSDLALSQSRVSD